VSQLRVTIGLPGSGKTTEAKRWVADEPLRRTRLNRDDLRDMMFGGWTGLDAHEKAVTAAQHSALRALLAAGWGVVVDDTNLRPWVVEALCRIGWDAGADVEVWDRTNVPIEVCVGRDRERLVLGERHVGEAVIRAMHAEWLAPSLGGGAGATPQDEEGLGRGGPAGSGEGGAPVVNERTDDFPALQPADEIVQAYLAAFEAARRTPRGEGEAERFGLMAALGVFAQRLEGPRGAGLCDCDARSQPANPRNNTPMTHHCDCQAVATVEALLGSRGRTSHARECVCWTFKALPNRKESRG
jgi:predicted kinase